jgi:hypothetical protein
MLSLGGNLSTARSAHLSTARIRTATPASGTPLGMATLPSRLKNTVPVKFRLFKLHGRSLVVVLAGFAKIIIRHVGGVEALAHNWCRQTGIAGVPTVDERLLFIVLLRGVRVRNQGGVSLLYDWRGCGFDVRIRGFVGTNRGRRIGSIL